MAHIDPQIVHQMINGETIETTPEHSFYVVVSDSWMPLSERGGWIAASALRVGDAIWSLLQTVLSKTEVHSCLLEVIYQHCILIGMILGPFVH